MHLDPEQVRGRSEQDNVWLHVLQDMLEWSLDIAPRVLEDSK